MILIIHVKRNTVFIVKYLQVEIGSQICFGFSIAFTSYRLYMIRFKRGNYCNITADYSLPCFDLTLGQVGGG